MREPTREGTPLDPLFANREELVEDLMVGGHLGHSNCEVRVFNSQIWREVSRTATFGLPEGKLWPL